MRLNSVIRYLVPVLALLSPGAPCFGGESADSLLTVGKIVVAGNGLTKPEIIIREMSTRVGEPLLEESLEHDRDRIYSLQLFNRVDINYYVVGQQATVVVNVHERWYVFPFPVLGFKYHSLRNLYYGAGITHQNFRGRNEKITFSFALGFDRWVDLSYSNPKISDDDHFLGISLNASRIQNLRPNLELYHRLRYSGTVSFGKRFGLYQALMGWMGYDIWKAPTDVPDGTLSSDGQDQFPTIGVSYALDTRDLREYTTRGHYLMLFASKHGWGSSSVDYFRYGFNAKEFQPVLGDAALGMRLYGTFTGGGRVPPYRFVYFGYEEKIRGTFHSVNEGEHLFGGNVELRIPLLKPTYIEVPFALLPEFSVWRFGLSAAVFADAGKVWYRTESFGGQPWASGGGVGLHFLFPYSVVVRTEFAIAPRGRGELVLDLGASF